VSPAGSKTRAWFADKAQEVELSVEEEAAPNYWVTLAGRSGASLVVGSHLYSVPNSGWRDGCLGVFAGSETLRLRGPRATEIVLVQPRSLSENQQSFPKPKPVSDLTRAGCVNVVRWPRRKAIPDREQYIRISQPMYQTT
jgi:hypothetical protein